MGKDELFSSALVGAGGAALWWWKQDADDRDNRIRTNQLDVRDLSRSFDLLVGGSDWIRLQAPTMRDHIIGIAAATPESQPSETVPPLVASVQRPDLSGGANIPGLAWPPSIGTYDSTGKTRAPGELATAAYVSTFQEPRAWAQGLTQSRPPSPTALLQLFYAAQGLSAAAGAQNLSPPQWVNLWTQLFGGVIPAPAPGRSDRRPQIYPCLIVSLAGSSGRRRFAPSSIMTERERETQPSHGRSEIGRP